MIAPNETDYRKYLDPATLARISSLDLRARLIVEGLMTGMHRSPYQGISVELRSTGQYVAGDDIRHVDWKVFGKTDKIYLKQYQEETNLNLICVVDASESMGFSSINVEGMQFGASTITRRPSPHRFPTWRSSSRTRSGWRCSTAI